MPNKSEFPIKICQTNNFEKIESLANQIWPDAFKDILSNDQISYMLERMYKPSVLLENQANGHRFYILFRAHKEIGFFVLQEDFPIKGKLRIHKFYLHPSEQGKGLGKTMMDKVVEIAQQKCVKFLHLNVNKYNQTVHFYKKYGFEIRREEDIDIGNGYFMNDYVMEKKL